MPSSTISGPFYSFSASLSISSSTSPPPYDNSDSSGTRTIGILVALAIIAIGVVVGGIIYFNRNQTRPANNNYVTLADKLNTRSSRPGSPTQQHEHGGTTISMNETQTNEVHINPAFGFDDNFVPSNPTVGGSDGQEDANKHDIANRGESQPNFNDPNFKFEFDEFQYQDKQHRMSESSL